MDRAQRSRPTRPDHDPVEEYRDTDDEDVVASQDGLDPSSSKETPFSLVEYSIFLLMGVAMLWAWNGLLASAPYFQYRFSTSPWLLSHFQSAELSVATIANLGAMLILSHLQTTASYPRRIILSLLITAVAFTLLALSTLIPAPAPIYFAFLLPTVLISSLGTGLLQNGIFAFAAGFGRAEYMQAIMTGQAVAGVLPPLVQIVSVLAVPEESRKQGFAAPEASRAAFWYFLAAVGVAVGALAAFLYLLRRQRRGLTAAVANDESEVEPLVAPSPTFPPSTHPKLPPGPKPSIPLLHLFRKLRPLALAVTLCFATTMLFPSFTTAIPSLSPSLPNAIFIPLAFLAWNLGDLLGRLSTLLPLPNLTRRPWILFGIAVARVGFVPLYLLCNVQGRGAAVGGDAFYLVVVQGGFGWSNGYVGSSCMVGAGEWVDSEEREAAGGFMGLCLVGGLAVGSLLSFGVGEI